MANWSRGRFITSEPLTSSLAWLSSSLVSRSRTLLSRFSQVSRGTLIISLVFSCHHRKRDSVLLTIVVDDVWTVSNIQCLKRSSIVVYRNTPEGSTFVTNMV